MANVPISNLPAATALSDTDAAPWVVSGTTSKVTWATLRSLLDFPWTIPQMYGAEGDGVTDDTTAINDAIAAVNADGGGFVLFPAGTYIVTGLTMLSNVGLIGEGSNASIIKLKSGTQAHMLVCTSVSNISISSMQWDGNKVATGGGFHTIRLESVSDVWISGNTIKNGSAHAINVVDAGNRIFVTENILKDNGLASDGSGCVIVNSDNVVMADNISYGNELDGLQDKNSSNVTYNGNVCYDNVRHGIFRGTATGVSGAITGNTVYQNDIGIFVQTCMSTSITSNVSHTNERDGIRITDSRFCSATGNICYNNGQGAGSGGGIRIDAATSNTDHNVVVGNVLFDDQTGSETQGQGVLEVQTLGTVGENVIVGNAMYGNVGALGGGVLRVAATTIVHENVGHTTESAGAASISSGSTSAVVNHSLQVTPEAKDISIVFTEQGLNDYGRWWISNITASQFTLNVSADPGGSNLDFAWQVYVH